MSIKHFNKDTKYPIAFLTNSNRLFMMSKSEISGDGTPRYIPNPKSSATYSLTTCMELFVPIYDKKTFKLHKDNLCIK